MENIRSSQNKLAYTLVKAAVASFHVKNRDRATLGGYHCQATVGITKHQHGLRLHFDQYFIGAGAHKIPVAKRNLACLVLVRR